MLPYKLCKDCGLTLPAERFSRDKSKKSGLCTYCKDCQKIRMDKYYADNRDVISARSTKWCRDNRERYSTGAAERRRRNSETLLPKRRKRHKMLMETSPQYRLNNCIRAHLRRIIAGGGESGSVGYSMSDLKLRMEVQFKYGMTWDNYGEWEIDHKIPISVFIARGETRSRVINCLANLQPLWKAENRSKGARYVG